MSERDCCDGFGDWHEADCGGSEEGFWEATLASLKDLLASPPGSTVFVVEGETHVGMHAGGLCEHGEVIGYLDGDRYVVLDAKGVARIVVLD